MDIQVRDVTLFVMNSIVVLIAMWVLARLVAALLARIARTAGRAMRERERTEP
jgi:multisubunit Na+/H+ antiporter MnhG subunit